MMTEDVVRRTGRLLQRLLGAAPVNASGEPAEGRWFRPSPLASVTLCVLWSVMGSIRADTVGITTVPAEVFGLQGDGHSGLSRARSISEDGCRVTFSSDATNLVAGDTNGKTDVFVHNSCSNPPVTMRVSLNNVGIQGNNRSYSSRENPRLCRGDSNSLTFPGVYSRGQLLSVWIPRFGCYPITAASAGMSDSAEFVW